MYGVFALRRVGYIYRHIFVDSCFGKAAKQALG